MNFHPEHLLIKSASAVYIVGVDRKMFEVVRHVFSPFLDGQMCLPRCVGNCLRAWISNIGRIFFKVHDAKKLRSRYGDHVAAEPMKS